MNFSQTPIPLDMLIAAHPMGINNKLVTNNEKEFSRVNGLKFENWMKQYLFMIRQIPVGKFLIHFEPTNNLIIKH